MRSMLGGPTAVVAAFFLFNLWSIAMASDNPYAKRSKTLLPITLELDRKPNLVRAAGRLLVAVLARGALLRDVMCRAYLEGGRRALRPRWRAPIPQCSHA